MEKGELERRLVEIENLKTCCWFKSPAISEENEAYFRCHMRCKGYDKSCVDYSPLLMFKDVNKNEQERSYKLQA